MHIGQFAKICRISIDTLRYYDKIGLLVPKRKNNIRIYDEKDIKKIKVIKQLKNMNFSLKDIKRIIELDSEIDNMLESGLNNKEMYEYIQQLNIMLNEKYLEILQHENNLLEVKKNLEFLINKVKKYLEEDLDYE